jgi:putative proteasome-type protease
MHIFEIPGERFIAAMSAGNLGVSQVVVNMLHEGIETMAASRRSTLYRAARRLSLHAAPGLDRIDNYINELLSLDRGAIKPHLVSRTMPSGSSARFRGRRKGLGIVDSLA